MLKYPKTPRLESVLREDLHSWRKLNTVVSEKLDGANVGVSFKDSKLVLQSRGHVLRGGPRERLFDRFKAWGREREEALYGALGGRYVLFGEWLAVKHRVFYDMLPSYFIGLDVYDRELGDFLPTWQQEKVREGLGIHSPPLLHRSSFSQINNFAQYIGPSRFKSDRWRERLVEAGGDPDVDTDDSILMEGVYVKIEDHERVVGRMKLPREEFEKVRSDGFWDRPFIPNRLIP